MFLQDCPLRWAPAFNLTHGRPQWVPIDWFYLINEYNGPAAGNTLEEAISAEPVRSGGTSRRIGHLATSRRATPLIDPASLQDPAAVELVHKFQAQGIQLFLRDFSLDTGIPYGRGAGL